MATFDAMWPIEGPWNHSNAAEAVADDLIDMLEAEGYAVAGWPTFTRTERHLAAQVPAMRDLAGGDARPWESREAWAENDLGAYETWRRGLLREQFRLHEGDRLDDRRAA
jgi:hypothetical protein